MADPLLAEISDLADLLGETIDGSDPKAERLLRSASAIVRSPTGCGQYITKVLNDVVKVTARSGILFLPEMPVVSVSLIERLERDGTTWTTVPTTSFLLDEEAGTLEPTTRWVIPTPLRWRVTYTHGYAEIPDGIAAAVLGLAARAWETPIGVDNERIGQRSIKYLMIQGGFTDEEQAALSQYRRPRIS